MKITVIEKQKGKRRKHKKKKIEFVDLGKNVPAILNQWYSRRSASISRVTEDSMWLSVIPSENGPFKVFVIEKRVSTPRNQFVKGRLKLKAT